MQIRFYEHENAPRMPRHKVESVKLSPARQGDRMVNVDYNHVAVRAYFAWEHEGRPEGRDLEFWLAAEIREKLRA